MMMIMKSLGLEKGSVKYRFLLRCYRQYFVISVYRTIVFVVLGRELCET